MNALFRLQQVLGHGHLHGTGQPLDLQQLCNAGRCVAGTGQNDQAVVRVHGLRQRMQTMVGARAPLPGAGILRMYGKESCILPRHAQPCARKLQRGHIGQDVQRLRTQPRRQIGGNAPAKRVTGGQHHAALPGLARGADPAGHGLELAGEIVRGGPGLELAVEQRQRARRTDDHIGRADVGQRGGRQAGGAIVQYTDDAAGIGVGHGEMRR